MTERVAPRQAPPSVVSLSFSNFKCSSGTGNTVETTVSTLPCAAFFLFLFTNLKIDGSHTVITVSSCNKNQQQIMGGDGGVIASNRKYLRGAGTADHTGDSQRNADKTCSDKEVSQELMSLCYLTKAPLILNQAAIVADPYGRLYHKEAAVEALLRRKHNSNKDEFGPHVRGFRDLMDVRFHVSNGTAMPSCPVTGEELNGQHPALLIRNNHTTGANVISERAIKEMGAVDLQSEFGPFDVVTDLVRLAPPPAMMDEIVEAIRVQHEQERTQEKSSKKSKKRKPNDHGDQHEQSKRRSRINKTNGESRQIKAARQRVQTAVNSNNVLSSLFTDSSKVMSEKEKNNTLFARMG